ncbi:MAG: hypothetical protein WCZ43_06155 [Proteiniphilum sp.]
MKENGNKPAVFDVDKMTVFEVTVIEVRDDDLTRTESIPTTVPVAIPVSDQVKELVNVLKGEISRTQLMEIIGVKQMSYF